MLPWFTKYPNQNDEILNLDWVIRQVENLKAAYEAFLAANSLTFADPILWDITKQYSKNTIVLSYKGDAYLSKKVVGKGIQLNNTDYWLEIFNFTEYVRTANSNLTMHIELNTTSATDDYAVDDWLLWEDVLYKVTAAIAVDDLLTVGTNIVHFTVEDFCRAWQTYMVNTIAQYKNDIDASELGYKNELSGIVTQYKNDIDASESAYRAQLAGDIASTTASLQAQLNTAIAGATVDSEVINIRVGANGITYSTAGDAVRGQYSALNDAISIISDANNVTSSVFVNSGTINNSGEITYYGSGVGVLLVMPCKENARYKISKTYGNRFRIGYTKTEPNVNVTLFNFYKDDSLTAIDYYTGEDAQYIVLFGADDRNNYPRDDVLASCTVIETVSALDKIARENLVKIRSEMRDDTLINSIKGIKVSGNLVPYNCDIVEDHYAYRAVGSEIQYVSNSDYNTYIIFNLDHTKTLYADARFCCLTDENDIVVYAAENIESVDLSQYLTAKKAYISSSVSINSLIISYTPKTVISNPNVREVSFSNIENSYPLYLFRKEASMSANSELKLLNDLKSSLKFNLRYCFACDGIPTQLDIFASADGYNVFTCSVTPTLLTFSYANGEYTQEFEHGKTFANNLMITIESQYNTAVVTIMSNGAVFEQTVNFDIRGLYISRVKTYSDITNVEFSYTCSDYNHPIWLYGDSYFSYAQQRWMYYLCNSEYIKNCSVDAYPGETSSDALTSFKTNLRIAKPKYAVWCLGMNDGSDSGETPNSSWMNAITAFLQICEVYNITPILATIPTVPTINNEAKNSWVRSSGYQYIDFAKAVGATANGVWYGDMLSNDGVHPSNSGGRTLYRQVLVDFPQIMVLH